jgi:hypothetical protein
MQLAAQRATAAISSFAAEHIGELLDERMPAAKKVCDDLADALEGLLRAIAGWNDAEAETRSLLQLAGRSDLVSRMPTLDPRLDYIASHCRQFDGEIPAPLPRAVLEPATGTRFPDAPLDVPNPDGVILLVDEKAA